MRDSDEKKKGGRSRGRDSKEDSEEFTGVRKRMKVKQQGRR